MELWRPCEIPWGFAFSAEKNYARKLVSAKFWNGNDEVYLKSALSQSAFSTVRFHLKQ